MAVALVAALAAAYGPSVLCGFVWDDTPLVVNNLLTSELSNVGAFFRSDLWQTAGGAESDSGYYRPVMLLSLAVDRALWGASAAGHHLQSLLWHFAGCAALFALLRQLVAPAAAWVGVALFALHPVQSEAVIWIAARNDLMAGAFLFAGVASLLPRDASPARIAAGGALVLLGMLSKESAVFAVVLLLFLDLAHFGRPVGGARYVAAGGAVAVWFGLRSWAGIEGASVPDTGQLGWLAGNFGQVGGHYLLKVFLPHPLSNGETAEYLDHGLAALGVAWLAGVVAAGLAVRRGGRLAIAGLGLAVLALGPALLTVAVRGQLGERYLYLPIGGLALALAAAWPARIRASLGALPVALVAVGLIAARTPDWADDVSLWGSAAETTPNPYSWTSFGFALSEADRPAEAWPWFLRALEHPVPYADACGPAVRLPLKVGDLDAAAHAVGLTEGCDTSPRLAGLRALVTLQTGDFEGAARIVEPHRGVEDARLPLVEAALELEEGDEAAMLAIAQRMPQPQAFGDQVRALHGIAAAARDRIPR
ncbi:MAG: hypothetical protein GY913_22025 [Proteobacteria bacterium]|nr:hypothetical protein [Pseudomonadota bacterium]MCP4919590.1 hypothetical protein [Pseudomonadota bacterium]